MLLRYQEGCKRHRSQRNKKTALQQLLGEMKYPKVSKKYEELHATKWLSLFEMHRLCNSFTHGERLVTEDGMNTTLTSIVAPFPCSLRNLTLNHGSALGKFCEEKAKEVLDDEATFILVLPAAIVSNDGTNACTFLSLKICSVLLFFCSKRRYFGWLLISA